MKITHQYKNKKIQKEISRDAGLILGNNLGNYFYLTNKEETKYQGFFYADGKKDKDKLTVYKIIDQIRILAPENLVRSPAPKLRSWAPDQIFWRQNPNLINYFINCQFVFIFFPIRIKKSLIFCLFFICQIKIIP